MKVSVFVLDRKTERERQISRQTYVFVYLVSKESETEGRKQQTQREEIK